MISQIQISMPIGYLINPFIKHQYTLSMMYKRGWIKDVPNKRTFKIHQDQAHDISSLTKNSHYLHESNYEISKGGEIYAKIMYLDILIQL